MNFDLLNLIGFVATFSAFIIFLPQAVTAWKHRDDPKALEGLLSEGNLYEHTKDYSIDTVQEKIKGLEDSAYSDEALPADVETLDIRTEETTAYEHTESYRLESGKRLSVTIGYVNIGRNQQEFLVTDYRLYTE